MAGLQSHSKHKPRELRRRVVLPARLRLDSVWSEACILNISSRGLMVQMSQLAEEGCLVELRRGEHAILARVVWRNGSRAGLRAEERLPVEDILTLSQAPALQLTAANGKFAERRKRPRTRQDSRMKARAIEFAGVAFIAASLGVAGFIMVEAALARPLAMVEAALRG